MLRIRPWFLLLATLLLSSPAAWSKPLVLGIRLGLHPDATRLVLELSAPPAYRVTLLDGPPRIAIDLTDVEGSAALLPVGLGLARRVTYRQDGGPAHFEVLLAKPAAFHSLLWISAAGFGRLGQGTRFLDVGRRGRSHTGCVSASTLEPVHNPPTGRSHTRVWAGRCSPDSVQRRKPMGDFPRQRLV